MTNQNEFKNLEKHFEDDLNEYENDNLNQFEVEKMEI